MLLPPLSFTLTIVFSYVLFCIGFNVGKKNRVSYRVNWHLYVQDRRPSGGLHRVWPCHDRHQGQSTDRFPPRPGAVRVVQRYEEGGRDGEKGGKDWGIGILFSVPPRITRLPGIDFIFLLGEGFVSGDYTSVCVRVFFVTPPGQASCIGVIPPH